MSFLIKHITILIYAAQMRRELLAYKKNGSLPEVNRMTTGSQKNLTSPLNSAESKKGMTYRRKLGSLQGSSASS